MSRIRDLQAVEFHCADQLRCQVEELIGCFLDSFFGCIQLSAHRISPEYSIPPPFQRLQNTAAVSLKRIRYVLLHDFMCSVENVTNTIQSTVVQRDEFLWKCTRKSSGQSLNFVKVTRQLIQTVAQVFESFRARRQFSTLFMILCVTVRASATTLNPRPARSMTIFVDWIFENLRQCEGLSPFASQRGMCCRQEKRWCVLSCGARQEMYVPYWISCY